jgi:tetratricopeptide (TPR) repeat protein
LKNWIDREVAKGTVQSAILAAGLARQLGEFAQAEKFLADAEKLDTGSWKAVVENEQAALLWHRVRCAEAHAAWRSLADSAPDHFNRGLALLFLGQAAEARTELSKAIAALPETSGWQALAGLYNALAEMQ